MLQAARDTNVRRVVNASSSAVYGDGGEPCKTETMPPHPKSPYGAAKLATEYYCQVFTETYGLETVSLRYFNVFGPRQDPASDYAAVIPKFTAQMLDGQPPTIFGDGLQSRDFTYVDNVVEGNLLAAQARDAAGQVFNLAMGQQITLLELVSHLNQVLNTSIAPIHADVRLGDIKQSQADIEKAQAVLGYAPQTDFDVGLARTAAWFEAQSA